MTSSASGASTLDIREGDLVKATRKEFPEVVVTGRVKSTPTTTWVFIPGVGNLYDFQWDFEILERPKPEIPEDLLAGAINAYRVVKYPRLAGSSDPIPEDSDYRPQIAAVIHFINEYHNKKGTNA